MFNTSAAVNSLGIEIMSSSVNKLNQLVGVGGGWRADGEKLQCIFQCLIWFIPQYPRN